MKSINFSRDVLPHIIAVVVFLVATVIFFSPVFFDNKSLDQHDINQWKAGAQSVIDYREQTGEEALWSDSMFGGMPAYLIDVDWSDGIVSGFKGLLSLYLPHPVKNIFLAFLSFYLLLLAFKVRPYLAIAGALGFGFSTYLIIGLGAGHNARIAAAAYMPLVLAGIHVAFSGRRVLGFGLTALALALHLRENHLQITYYLLLMVIIYGIIQLIEAAKTNQLAGFLKTTGMLVIAAMIALGTFIGKFWTTYEYSKYSIRGKSELTSNQSAGEQSGLSRDYAFQYSNDTWGPMTMLIPNFLGGGFGTYFVQEEGSETLKALQQSGDGQMANQLARYTASFWGEKPPAPYYVGAIFCFLFVIGLIGAPTRFAVWLGLVTFLAILLSLGDSFESFNYFMFDYFPGYNKFRSVTFTMIMAFVSVPLLGMIGLESLLQQTDKKEAQRKLIIGLAITGGLCLLVALFAGIASFTKPGESQLPAWFLNALRADREAMMRGDALRSLIFIVLAAAAIFFMLKNKLSYPLAGLVLGLFILIDIVPVSKRHFGDQNYRRSADRSFFAATEADKFIKKDDAHYRVMNLQPDAMSEARTSYHHNSLGGYHGAKMRRYQDFYTYCLEEQRMQLINSVQGGSTNFSELDGINMLNAKYIVFGQGKNELLPNQSAFGNAWLAKTVKAVNSPDEEIDATCGAQLDSVAVIDVSKFKISLYANYATKGNVTLTKQTPNELSYKADVSGDALAVFSEIYYPVGWKAYIDGKESEILRANYLLRALELPAGQHEIVFKFEPKAYAIGDTIMMISGIILLLVVVGTVGWSVKESLT